MKKEVVVLSSEEIRRTLYRLAHQILEKDSVNEDFVLVGIHTRGVYLARRLQKIIQEIDQRDVELGTLDITFYRDDLTAIGPKPVVRETNINFDLKGKVVILVDDVLFTGRTIRAGLDEIMDFGRPKRIELLVLVDRGHRELPIRADFVGKNIPTAEDEVVEARLQEIDQEDAVVLIKKSKDDDRD